MEQYSQLWRLRPYLMPSKCVYYLISQLRKDEPLCSWFFITNQAIWSACTIYTEDAWFIYFKLVATYNMWSIQDKELLVILVQTLHCLRSALKPWFHSRYLTCDHHFWYQCYYRLHLYNFSQTVNRIFNTSWEKFIVLTIIYSTITILHLKAICTVY